MGKRQGPRAGDQKEDEMSNWGEGYRSGYRAMANKFLFNLTELGVDRNQISELVDKIMLTIYEDTNGQPSFYAVANKCCGGVDAHSPGCIRA